MIRVEVDLSTSWICQGSVLELLNSSPFMRVK